MRKLLVANRGEIARRVFRTCRRLGVATVAVYSDADADAPFVREADEAVPLGGQAPSESYLRIDAVVSAARLAGADAVHPGYGFLSENAAFARACAGAGLTFVGPSAEAIELMGSKLAARELMAGVGVPVLPGADLTGVVDADLREAADEVGWPVLVKASYGGGGRGMRIVRDPDTLPDAVAAARREAQSAFGDGTVFLERYVDAPRHIEVQIFGDAHGHLTHLNERECSIQRRHQKIIEESPSPAVSEPLRREMGAAAVAAGKTIGYVGAGTVEFILAPTGEFFFLEVNTRLQVEHPVTELVTGLDLVELQLLVAQGEPLPAPAFEPRIVGHGIEARLYAEDPHQQFLPSAGRLDRFSVPGGEGVRVDSGVEDGSVVTANYDPLLAKVIAYGPTREHARRRLAAALRRSQVFGLTTNRDLLVGVLEHPEFAVGAIDTHFLERHEPAGLADGVLPAGEADVCAVAAALVGQAARRAHAPQLPHLPSGWRNNPSQLQRTCYLTPSGERCVDYRLDPKPYLEVDGQPVDVQVLALSPHGADLLVHGVRRRFDVVDTEHATYVSTSYGSVTLTEIPRFPDPDEHHAAGSQLAPMPGSVVRVEVSAGDRVEQGQVLVVLEAMKMEHRIVAPEPGVVSAVEVARGAQVSAGDVLVVLDEEVL